MKYSSHKFQNKSQCFHNKLIFLFSVVFEYQNFERKYFGQSFKCLKYLMPYLLIYYSKSLDQKD